MQRIGVIGAGCLAIVLWAGVSIAAGPVRGERTILADVKSEEVSRQPDLWMMEVRFKPMRLVTVELTDKTTGNKKKESIWYIGFKVINRPFETKVIENRAVNTTDPPTGPQMFIPEITLLADKGKDKIIYPDEVIPEAVAEINRIEGTNYKSTVDVVAPIPKAVPAGSAEEEILSAVATWRGIDPDVDRYTVLMTGFSNVYRIKKSEDGEIMRDDKGRAVLQFKTIRHSYWRPGDRFDQKDWEIHLDGPIEWIYR